MEKIFGLETDPLSAQTLGVLKNALLLRHPLKADERIPLTSAPAPFAPGVSLIERGEGKRLSSRALIAGVVRMGYGHYRMAYAAATWAQELGREPAIHDLLAVQSPGAELIREIDMAYSFFSRVSADLGGPLEWAWGLLMSRGNVNSLFFSDSLAREMTGLIADLPRELPVVSAYPLHAQIAAHAGFKTVVNMVPDNFPQYFLLAPGAVNMVQGPAAYDRFREMGAPASSLAVAGHWVSHALAANAVRDSEERIKRIDAKKPRRILLPIGGAGAQRKLVLDLIAEMLPQLIGGEIKLLLNAGDHKAARDAFAEDLTRRGVSYRTIQSWEEMLDFVEKHPLKGGDPAPAVCLFHFDSHFAAFAATDCLMRVADVLATKPSELAFFPIPKLFLRRVGDHEAASALRSQELGEGGPECRETPHVMKWVNLMTREDDILRRMNEAVIQNAKNEVYNGAKAAVELAIEMAR